MLLNFIYVFELRCYQLIKQCNLAILWQQYLLSFQSILTEEKDSIFAILFSEFSETYHGKERVFPMLEFYRIDNLCIITQTAMDIE